ncbi:hypothetical protein BH09VER1_BH09VER1_00050 [soil metagenome]
MSPSHSWHRVLSRLLFAGILLSQQQFAHSQVSFYGAPPPSSYSNNIGGNETTPNVDNRSLGDIGLGIFAQRPFKLSLAVREGFDSNVFTTKNDPISSFYTNVSGGIDYSFGSPRLQLGSNLNGGVTYYYNRPGDKIDLNGTFSTRAIYKATPRLTLALNTQTAYLAQPDISIVGSTNRQNGDYLYSNTTFSAAYQWTEIFSTVTAYNFTVFYYVDDTLNQEQGRIDQTVSQSLRWLILPKTTLIAEYRANPVVYFNADLNQFSNFFLVGIDQIFNPRFTWNGRLGAQLNFNQNPVDGSSIYIGPYMESTLNYQFGPASTVYWNMRYGTEASGLTNVTQRQTFRTGVGVNHAITARLSANLGMNYQCNYYSQSDVIPSFIENIVDFSAGLRFAINRHAALEAGYQFTIDIAPNASEREYSRNVVFVGANLNF